MISSNEFGVLCLNTRTTETFNIIKTDAFILITEEGLPIIEDKPMFNTSMKMIDSNGDIITTDIKQDDILTIETKNFKVRDVRKDGIGGSDIYLKD
ncbi:MAG: hypothetical protein ACTSP9_13210 [Promethearchaeota archaeon]